MASAADQPDIPDFTDYTINPTTQTGWHGIDAIQWAILNNDYSDEQTNKFLISDPLVDVDEDRWKPVRPLGRGTFGTVALFNHKNLQGEVDDEMVIKEGGWREELDVSPNRLGLATEAVLQFQLNERNCPNVAFLRQFKFLDDGIFANRKHRMYSEFCAYGSLEKLRQRYKAWYQHFPEHFLWHIFHSLAIVAHEMSLPPWTDYITNTEYPEGWHLLHLDLKLDNIVIGKQRLVEGDDEAHSMAGKASSGKRKRADDGESRSKTRPLPMLVDPAVDDAMSHPPIKIIDFGVARIVGKSPNGENDPITSEGNIDRRVDRDMPDDYFWRGTEGFMPPEQRHYGLNWLQTVNYPRPPYKTKRTTRGGERVERPDPVGLFLQQGDPALENAELAAIRAGLVFGPEHNIWAIGKIMYDLLTLAAARELDRDLNRLDEEDYLRENGNIVQINTHPHEYSQALKDLVKECLRVRKDQRPSPVDLQTRTAQGVADSNVARHDDTNEDNDFPAYVYYRDNEVNGMPLGPRDADVRYDRGDFARLVNRRYEDLDMPLLRPKNRYLSLARQHEANDWQRPVDRRRPLPFEVSNGRIRYRRPAGQLSVPTPQQSAQQPAAPQAPPADTLPTIDEYMQMMKDQLADELRARGILVRDITNQNKAGYVAALMAADTGGNLGNGFQERREPKRRKKAQAKQTAK